MRAVVRLGLGAGDWTADDEGVTAGEPQAIEAQAMTTTAAAAKATLSKLFTG